MQPVTHLVCGHRTGEEVALRRIAFQFPEQLTDSLAFDAFGDDVDVEVVSKGYGGADDEGVTLVVIHVSDERLVDLDRPRRQQL